MPNPTPKEMPATVRHGNGWDNLRYVRFTADGTEQSFRTEPKDHPELLVLRVFQRGSIEQTCTWNALPIKQPGASWVCAPSRPPGDGWTLRKKCQKYSYWRRAASRALSDKGWSVA